MLFKKKEKKEIPTHDVDIKFDGRLRALEEETHQLISDHNFGLISDEEFEEHKADIRKRIEQFKEDYNNRYLDDLMDSPMQKIDRFFGSLKDETD